MNSLLIGSAWLPPLGRVDIPTPFILALIIALAVIILFITLVQRYKRCPSNKILVIFGKTGSGAARCVHGGAAFIWPLFQSYAYLDLEPFVVPIDLTNALSQENIRVAVPTTVTAAISNQPGIMENAAVRLLGLSTKQIESQAQDIILGQMRAVIATMGIEEINRDRQAFMGKVNEAVSVEMEKIGLQVINVNIRDIQDESGYILALGRKAAAEAINQANVDVAEQEKTGKTGVAERERDTRKAVAAANADAEIGEASADRDKRMRVAGLDAEAVEAESKANANKAAYMATQRVAEEEARRKGESAAREADGAIRVAQENAAKKAEDARSQREQSRLNAEVVVPAAIEREKVVIAAEARKLEAIRVAEGDAEAIIARKSAEARGEQAILEAKAMGYLKFIESCGGGDRAAVLLVVEKLAELAGIQAKAIHDLPIEKIFVWDSGGEKGGMSNLGQRLMGALPPMHELARQVGLELPEYFGRFGGDPKDQPAPQPVPPPARPTSPTPPPQVKK
jgi:flotillin